MKIPNIVLIFAAAAFVVGDVGCAHFEPRDVALGIAKPPPPPPPPPPIATESPE